MLPVYVRFKVRRDPPLLSFYLVGYSGLAFGTFVVIHVITAFSGMFGPMFYDGVLALFRNVYHLPPVELWVLWSLNVHQVCGVIVAWRRFSRARAAQKPVTPLTILHPLSMKLAQSVTGSLFRLSSCGSKVVG